MIVKMEGVDEDENVMGFSFVMTMKNTDRDHPVPTARFVVQRNVYKYKVLLMHKAIKTRQNAVSIFFKIAAIEKQALIARCNSGVTTENL